MRAIHGTKGASTGLRRTAIRSHDLGQLQRPDSAASGHSRCAGCLALQAHYLHRQPRKPRMICLLPSLLRQDTAFWKGHKWAGRAFGCCGRHTVVRSQGSTRQRDDPCHSFANRVSFASYSARGWVLRSPPYCCIDDDREFLFVTAPEQTNQDALSQHSMNTEAWHQPTPALCRR